MTQPCCSTMARYLDWSCADHDDPWKCPDAIIVRGGDGTFGLPVRDGGRSMISIGHCPWCAVELVPDMVAPHIDELAGAAFPLLRDVAPELAFEIEAGLREQQASALADSIRGLRIHSRCRCDDPSCGSFFTGPRPDGTWGSEHRNLVVDLDCAFMAILDVVDGTIRYVELIDSPQVAGAIRALELD